MTYYSVENLRMDITGPKIYSRAMVIWSVTFVKIVGAMK